MRSVTQVPLVVSFSYDRGTRTMMGVRPSVMAAELADLGVDVLGINCGRSLEDNRKALAELRSATQLPIWFKPNAGLPVLDEAANPTYTISPEQMGAEVPLWLAAGAQIVGGCCGTSPAHLSAIARMRVKITTRHRGTEKTDKRIRDLWRIQRHRENLIFMNNEFLCVLCVSVVKFPP